MRTSAVRLTYRPATLDRTPILGVDSLVVSRINVSIVATGSDDDRPLFAFLW